MVKNPKIKKKNLILGEYSFFNFKISTVPFIIFSGNPEKPSILKILYEIFVNSSKQNKKVMKKIIDKKKYIEIITFKIKLREPLFFNYGFFLLFSVNPENNSKDITTRLIEFYYLWPLHQWISSLAGLILLYWVTGYYYNKWLSKKGGWLDWKTRSWLIFSDLAINLMLGLYYMNHRETAIGAMMLQCPIAISPLIFILELICFYIYSRSFVRKKKTTLK